MMLSISVMSVPDSKIQSLNHKTSCHSLQAGGEVADELEETGPPGVPASPVSSEGDNIIVFGNKTY